MSAPTTPPPEQSLHDRLLAAFLDPALNLLSIAESFGLTLAALVAWAASPRAQADLEGVRQLSRFRAQLLADCDLPAAVESLSRTNSDLAAIEPHEDAPLTLRLRLADTVRKTATAITRMATPRTARHAPANRAHTTSTALANAVSDVPSGAPEPTTTTPDPIRAPMAAPPARARDRPVTAVAA